MRPWREFLATDSTTQWFQQGLGTRVDALEVAQQAMRDGDRQAANTARQIAKSLFGQAERYGFPAIRDAAYRVAHCADHDLEQSTVELIALLRRKAADASQAKSTILIIGGDGEFNEALTQKLQ